MNRSDRAARTVARYLEWYHVRRFVEGLILNVDCDHTTEQRSP